MGEIDIVCVRVSRIACIESYCVDVDIKPSIPPMSSLMNHHVRTHH